MPNKAASEDVIKMIRQLHDFEERVLNGSLDPVAIRQQVQDIMTGGFQGESKTQAGTRYVCQQAGPAFRGIPELLKLCAIHEDDHKALATVYYSVRDLVGFTKSCLLLPCLPWSIDDWRRLFPDRVIVDQSAEHAVNDKHPHANWKLIDTRPVAEPLDKGLQPLSAADAIQAILMGASLTFPFWCVVGGNAGQRARGRRLLFRCDESGQIELKFDRPSQRLMVELGWWPSQTRR